MTQLERLNALLNEVFLQRYVDTQKATGTTDVYWLQFIYAAVNAVQAIDPTNFYPGDSSGAFTDTAGWFSEHGYPAIATLFNMQDGEGDFDAWPWVYHEPA